MRMLPPEIVKAIFEARAKGMRVVEIAKQLDINKNTVVRYLRTYSSFEDYLKNLKEREYKKLAYTPTPSTTTAIHRIIAKQAIDYSSQQLAEQYSIYRVFKEELEDLANKLDISTEELLKFMIYYFKKSAPEYIKLKEENMVLKKRLMLYQELINLVVSLLDEELYTRLKELIAVSTAIETKSKEFLLKLIGGY